MIYSYLHKSGINDFEMNHAVKIKTIAVSIMDQLLISLNLINNY